MMGKNDIAKNLWRQDTGREYVQTNSWREFQGELDIVTEIKRNRISRAGHVQRMIDNRAVKKVLNANACGKVRRGRPRKDGWKMWKKTCTVWQ